MNRYELIAYQLAQTGREFDQRSCEREVDAELIRAWCEYEGYEHSVGEALSECSDTDAATIVLHVAQGDHAEVGRLIHQWFRRHIAGCLLDRIEQFQADLEREAQVDEAWERADRGLPQMEAWS
jgi:hypothetical protein